MYELLLALIVVLFAIIKGREHFGIVVGTPDWITTDTDTDKGFEIFSTTPNTCPPEKPELDAGLCYKKCKPGFHGVGPVCWADSVSIGVGKAVGLEPCPHGWSNDGLICREPIRCEPVKCASGWDFFKKGCSGGKCSGGRLRGRLDGGGICDWPSDRGNLPGWLVDKSGKEWKATHPDKIAGLCYKKCPPDLPVHMPGMPYLCYKGGELSYPRGAGAIPSILRIARRFNPF
jgi:hypothetical protein